MIWECFGDNKKGILTAEFEDYTFIFACLMHAKGRRKLYFVSRCSEDDSSISNCYYEEH